MFLAVIIVLTLFFIAGSRKSLVPRGVQNLVETIVEFIEDQIILQVMGPGTLGWTPYLLTIFIFVVTLNLIGLIPLIQMPVNARMAIPALLGIQVWLIYNFI